MSDNTPQSNEIKGALNGLCNRSACLAPGANLYNHSTREHYCERCAKLINDHNRNDARRTFGHDLCTFVAIPKEQPTEHHRENCPCEICSTIRSAERRDPSNAPDLKKEETQNELWQEVIRMPEPIGTLESLISVFSSKFTITRK